MTKEQVTQLLDHYIGHGVVPNDIINKYTVNLPAGAEWTGVRVPLHGFPPAENLAPAANTHELGVDTLPYEVNIPQAEHIDEVVSAPPAPETPLQEMPTHVSFGHLSYANPLEGDYKGHFSHYADGSISGFDIEELATPKGKGITELRNLVLKDSWKEKIFNRPPSVGNLATTTGNIEKDALQLGQRVRMLESMRDIGEGETKEYAFLKERIAETVKNLGKKYGTDIFKKDLLKGF